MADLSNRIKRIMKNVFNLTSVQLKSELSQENIEEWDSLKHMTLVVALEEELNVSFKENEIPKLTSLDNILSVIKKKL